MNKIILEVLKYSLKWLDDWEARAGVDVTDNQFLTKSTSEGLRVTLNSCIELTDYLIDKFGFKYVLYFTEIFWYSSNGIWG